MPLADWKAALRQQEKAPQYRFRGHLSPEQLPRTPIVNTAEAAVENGVVTMRLYDPIDSWGGDWGVSAKEFTAVLDKVKDADGDDEGEEEPVGHIDMRLAAPHQRSGEDGEIDEPDGEQQQIRVPFRLRIFLALRDAERIAGERQDQEQLIAEENQHRELAPAPQADLAGALHDI